jgi:hypothetical protein
MSADERDVPVRFAEGFFHEARNAVFGLSVTLDALEEGADPGAALVQQVRTLASLSDRTARLMHDLVAYVEAPAGGEWFVSSRTVIEQGILDARERLGSRKLEVTGLDAVGDHLRTDPAMLARSICSVLQGVAIALPAAEPIRLTLTQASSGAPIELRIVASGGEVAAERIVTFFEPFAIRGSRITGFAVALAKRRFVQDGVSVLLVRNGVEGLSLTLTFPVHTSVQANVAGAPEVATR